MAKTDLTAERVRELFNYDPLTGILTQKTRTSRTVKIGDEVGHTNDAGYRVVSIGGPKHRVHRIAWLYMYGEFPAHEIDHINGIRNDNRIHNLRPATKSENMQNQKNRDSTKSGFRGVKRAPSKQESWCASIRKDGVSYYLGVHKTAELAHAAYLEAKQKLHTFNPLPRYFSNPI